MNGEARVKLPCSAALVARLRTPHRAWSSRDDRAQAGIESRETCSPRSSRPSTKSLPNSARSLLTISHYHSVSYCDTQYGWYVLETM